MTRRQRMLHKIYEVLKWLFTTEYTYYVSYVTVNSRGKHVGSSIITRSLPIDSKEQIDDVTKYIKEKFNVDEIVVLGWNSLK